MPTRLQVQIAATNAVLAVPPFRSRRFKRWAVQRTRARRRARRRAEEARGSDALSRPALDTMQEQLLAEIGPDGFFVEAGANDGFDQSNTYWLERFHGWRGVLVEGVPDLYREAVVERPSAQVFHCALVADDHPEPTVTMRTAGLMSIVAGARGGDARDEEWVALGNQLKWSEPVDVEVPARTLTSVLEEAGAPRPDLISLDVEGYEPHVLRGLDWDRFGPRFLLVEVRDSAARDDVDAIVGDRYELVRMLSPNDALYRARERVSSRHSGGTARSTTSDPA